LSIWELATGYARTHKGAQRQVEQAYGHIHRLRLGVPRSWKPHQIARLPPYHKCNHFRVLALELHVECDAAVKRLLLTSAPYLESLHLSTASALGWLVKNPLTFPKLQKLQIDSTNIATVPGQCMPWIIKRTSTITELTCDWSMIGAGALAALKQLERLTLTVAEGILHDCLALIANHKCEALQEVRVQEYGDPGMPGGFRMRDMTCAVQDLCSRLRLLAICTKRRGHMLLDKRVKGRERLILENAYVILAPEISIQSEWLEWLPQVDRLELNCLHGLYYSSFIARLSPRAVRLARVFTDASNLDAWKSVRVLELGFPGQEDFQPTFKTLDWVASLRALEELSLPASTVFDDVWDAPMPKWPATLARIHLKGKLGLAQLWIDANPTFIHLKRPHCCSLPDTFPQ
jgi:hypothetical protein